MTIDPILGLVLSLGSLLVGVCLLVCLMRLDEWIGLVIKDEQEQQQRLEEEINALEARIAELEATEGLHPWHTKMLLWRTRRRLVELESRLECYQVMARRWQSRANGVCLSESLPSRPYAIQLPSARERIKI